MILRKYIQTKNHSTDSTTLSRAKTDNILQYLISLKQYRRSDGQRHRGYRFKIISFIESVLIKKSCVVSKTNFFLCLMNATFKFFHHLKFM